MNYMSEVAKMLGVELGERFKINFDIYNSRNPNFDYYLSDKGVVLDQDGFGCSSNDVLCGLLYGNYTIRRKPWKPKMKEKYYFVDEIGYTYANEWASAYDDIILYKLGNCYRTSEEAEKNSAKWIEFYSSDEVLEV